MRPSLLPCALALAVAACGDAPTAPRSLPEESRASAATVPTSPQSPVTDEAIRKYVPNAPSHAAVARLKSEIHTDRGELPAKITDPWTGDSFGISDGACETELTLLRQARAIYEAALLAAQLGFKGDPVSAAAALAVAKAAYDLARAAYERCVENHSGSSGSGGGGSAGASGGSGGDVDLGEFNCTVKLGVKTCVPVAH